MGDRHLNFHETRDNLLISGEGMVNNLAWQDIVLGPQLTWWWPACASRSAATADCGRADGHPGPARAEPGHAGPAAARVVGAAGAGRAGAPGRAAGADPHTWYVGLWSPLVGLDPVAVGGLLERREQVRLPVMHSMIHLLNAGDALTLRPLTQPPIKRSTMRSFGWHLVDSGPGRAHRRGRPLAAIPVERLVLRYLATFGPATPLVVCGLRPLTPAERTEIEIEAEGAVLLAFLHPSDTLGVRGGDRVGPVGDRLPWRSDILQAKGIYLVHGKASDRPRRGDARRSSCRAGHDDDQRHGERSAAPGHVPAGTSHSSCS